MMEDPLLLMDEVDSEATLVTVLRRDGRSEVKRISLLGHCLFCLRRIQVQKIQNELLSTVNWVWAALQRRSHRGGQTLEEEDGNVFGVGVNWVNLEKISKFSSMPKLCQECQDNVTGLDRLLNKVREEIGELWRWIARSDQKERVLGFQGDTLQFVKDFRQLFEVPVNRRIDIDRGSEHSSQSVNIEVKSEPEDVSWCGPSVPLKNEVEEDGSGELDYGSDPDFPEVDDQDSDESESSEEQSDEEDDDDYIPSNKRAKVHGSSEQSNQKTNKEEAEKVPEPSKPQKPLKIQIPPGYTTSVKRDDSGKSIYLIVTNPINNRDYWICVLDSCGETFMGIDNHTSFERHKNEKHDPQKTVRSRNTPRFPCEHCGKSFTANFITRHRTKSCKYRNRNQRQTWKTKTTNCEVCSKKLTYAILKKHMETVHGLVNWSRRKPTTILQQCDFCKIRLPRIELLEHLKDHVGPDYVIRCPNPDCYFACIFLKTLDLHLGNRANCLEKTGLKDKNEFMSKLKTCSVCGLEFNVTSSLRGHLLRLHETAEKNYPCPVSGCRMSFSVRQSVVVHLTQHDIPKQLDTQPCLECKKKEVKMEEMEAHLKAVHGVEQVINCGQCPFRFTSREQLIDHMYEHRYGLLACDICGEAGGRFNKHMELVEHYFTQHQIGAQFCCEFCPKVFFKPSILQNHVGLVHNNSKNGKKKKSDADKTFACELCGTILKTEDGLRGHQIQEHGATPYACQLCNDTFTNISHLLEHKRFVHKGLPKPPTEFSCLEPNCGKVFKTKHKLEYHHKHAHLGEKRHVCDICGKAFALPHTLKTHIDGVHLGIRKYICNICEESFASGQVLRRHKLIHTGER